MADLPDALEEGKKRVAAGDIPSAVLCFEAAAKTSPDNAMVWQLLGTTQAENEQVIRLQVIFAAREKHFKIFYCNENSADPTTKLKPLSTNFELKFVKGFQENAPKIMFMTSILKITVGKIDKFIGNAPWCN